MGLPNSSSTGLKDSFTPTVSGVRLCRAEHDQSGPTELSIATVIWLRYVCCRKCFVRRLG